MTRIALSLLAFTITAAFAEPSDKDVASGLLLEKYFAAVKTQQDNSKGVSMEVLMEGKIPKLKKEGRLSALRHISKIGGITYKVLGFWGDDTVKKEVMGRYMTAEVEAAQQAIQGLQKQNIGLNQENYEFKYKGLQDKEGREFHVFELKPRQKRVGLFKGELWLDPGTCMPLREAGRLVKNPSIFVKNMEFVRDYELLDGVSFLKRMVAKTDTRLVGRAELNVEYANLQRDDGEAGREEARSAGR